MIVNHCVFRDKQNKEPTASKYPVNNKKAYLFTKRAFDIVASIIGMIICAIPMGIVALLIRLESTGPIIYKQERLGLNGKEFVMYKFRSMFADSEQIPQWAKENDDRCTKVGRIIRRCHVDELPQLINILIGDMSVVGPRPEREYFYDLFTEYIPDFRERLCVKPGLTGWAQVNGGYDITPEEKLELDVIYMKERSLVMDMKCIIKTVSLVFTGKGAR